MAKARTSQQAQKKAERDDKQTVGRGHGGELHQQGASAEQCLTTQQGGPVADNQNSLKAGVRGPTLLEDHILRDKIFHFDHERIPERVVHARGVGAHGFFETYESLADITCADIFQREGERTPAFVRFSTVAGSKGSADLARDVRGFAVKLYTREGNWDIVGNNIPVFFIQDAMKFPDLVHAAKEEPDRGFPQAQTAHDNFWDFVSLMPESMHMIMWTMSDRAIPRSLRFMEGFGVHSFRLINQQGEAVFVKFHWRPRLGLQSVVWDEALTLNGADPDFHRRDLWEAIQRGDFPEWELGIQVFDEAFAEKFEFDVLDATKLIPEEQVPIRPVGRLVLDRVVDNFFAETEQVAFCTQNIVNGIDFSEDPLLMGRNFSYLDTQLKRLGGPNFTHIPINAPKCPMHNFHQDGHMAMQNPAGRVNYEPNSWTENQDEQDEQGISQNISQNIRESPEKGFRSHAAATTGEKVRQRSETFADHYSQARQFYISQTEVEQQHIAEALTFELSKVDTRRIRERVVSHLRNIDDAMAGRVATGLGMSDLPAPAEAAMPTRDDLPVTDSLSIIKRRVDTFRGRKVGILASHGLDADIYAALAAALEDEGAVCEVVALTAGSVTTSKDETIKVDEKVEGGPSALYDAIAVLPGAQDVDALAQHPAAQDFVRHAFHHKKFIAYTESARPLLESAGIAGRLDEGAVKLSSKEAAAGFVKTCRLLRYWDRA